MGNVVVPKHLRLLGLWLITIVFVVSACNLTQSNKENPQQTVDAVVAAYFTQTATAQQQIDVTQTAANTLGQSLTATANFEGTVQTNFNAALTATAQVQMTATAESSYIYPQKLEVITATNVSRLKLISRIGRGTANAVAYSPDGHYLAVATSIGIWLYDLYNMINTPRLIESEKLTIVTISPDNQTLAAGGDDGSLSLWNINTGHILVSSRAHTRKVQSIAFSPDGTYLASGGLDGLVKIWSVSEFQEFETLSGHRNSVNSIVFSPNGKNLASVDYSEILLWDVDSGELRSKFERPQLVGEWFNRSIKSVTFALDGSYLISVGTDGTVQKWDIANNQLQIEFDSHLGFLLGEHPIETSVNFNSDRSTLAMASSDHKVWLWNYNDQRPPQLLDGHTDAVIGVAFSPDGMSVASVSDDGSVRLWNAITGELQSMLTGFLQPIFSVAINLDGTILASGSNNGITRLWNLTTGQIQFQYKLGDYGVSVAISPNSETLALGSEGFLQTRDIASGNILKIFLADENTSSRCAVGCLAFSPDGSILAAIGSDAINLWNVANGQLRTRFIGHEGEVNGLAFSPDGTSLASAGTKDSTIRIWDIVSGQLRTTFALPEGRQEPLANVAFSLDGSNLASGSIGGYSRLWDVSGLQTTPTVVGDGSMVLFDADGKLLFSIARWIDIWDMSSKQSIWTSDRLSNDFITSAVLSSDGKLLILGSLDGTISILGIATQ